MPFVQTGYQPQNVIHPEDVLRQFLEYFLLRPYVQNPEKRKRGLKPPQQNRKLLHKGKKNIPTKKNCILVRNWELDNNFADPQGIFGIIRVKLEPSTTQQIRK
jgi:hypothetical protein